MLSEKRRRSLQLNITMLYFSFRHMMESYFLVVSGLNVMQCLCWLGINFSTKLTYNLKPRQHVAINMLLVAINKIVASLLPVCCWIQRDTSRPWHKWIVIMSPRYSQHVARTSNLLPGNMLPSTYMLTATCFSSWQRVAGPWYKRGLFDCSVIIFSVIILRSLQDLYCLLASSSV